MILPTEELLNVYEGVVKPFGHPDPLGFMTRALLTSEGDPDYIAVDGRRGFLPIQPELALEMTGASEVQSLQGNLVAALTIDRMFFEKLRSVERMIIATHYGEENVIDEPTGKHKQFIEDINDGREDTRLLMYPPLATVADVIKLLNPDRVDKRLNQDEKDFFELLLRGG